MLRTQRAGRSPAHRSGTAMVELSVIWIILLPLLVGVWEVGRMVDAQQLMSNAVREAGRQASTGLTSSASTKTYIADYLTSRGVACVTSDITITNLTDAGRAEPTAANQLDRFQVTVVIPYSRIQYVDLGRITVGSELSVTSQWYSMRDIPISIVSSPPAGF